MKEKERKRREKPHSERGEDEKMTIEAVR